MSTFPIYQTHPILADALILASWGCKLPPHYVNELQVHALLNEQNELTSLARMILKERPQ